MNIKVTYKCLQSVQEAFSQVRSEQLSERSGLYSASRRSVAMAPAHDAPPDPSDAIKRCAHLLVFKQIYQSWLDKSTPFYAVRWAATLLLTAIYMIRVYILQGWYIVTYALGIYHLNLFIAFLSPKVDPSLLDEDDGPALPTKQNEEFRPFIRRLPEFKFWHSATKGIVIAMICTFFEAFNVPVFWPILVMYFIMLFCITMKRQIKVRAAFSSFHSVLLPY
ncbi:protein RER1-like [Boleophthalmus pectinirostris]|uniref:protein RER1-like n=1 Tax=Boleophthalmus pectinirostris TaxID=150288 RepID=UPI00242E5B5D|nr:protein RER1-like [Boleophthalmus pectinirostris]